MARHPLLIALLWLILAPDLSADEASRRATEWARWSCESSDHRRDLTLFANGTVRLKAGPPGEERMGLGELDPEDLEDYRRKLSAIDLTATDVGGKGPEGDQVELCRVALGLPEEPPFVATYRRFDSPSLALQRVVTILETLLDRVGPPRGEDRLPAGYEPRIGDVLRRVDGARFEVVSFTADGRGVELRGRDLPLIIYVEPAEMARLFEHLEERR
ncbi:MAG: hypothetical protein AAF604_00385 [Acidobacteriota bacterium]